MTNKAKEERKLRKKKEKDWSIMVKSNFNNKCAFCDAKKYIQAHHIIPRGIKEFKYQHINGVALCPRHHKWGMSSAHANPLHFFLMLEKYFPLKLRVLKTKYKKYIKDGKEV